MSASNRRRWIELIVVEANTTIVQITPVGEHARAALASWLQEHYDITVAP